MRRCSNYTCRTCIDGGCPAANTEKQEYGIPVIKSCAECYLYEGCGNCAWIGTDYCKERADDGTEE